MIKLLVHEAIARALAENGRPVLFGLVGDANMWLADSYVSKEGGRYVRASNEANVVLMASGNASMTGQVGFATVTHGPGLTNTVTALVDAVRAHMPIVVLAGDTPAVARFHLQNVDQRAVVLASGAGFEQVRTPQTVVADLREAHRRALAERRPIVLNVPSDFQFEEIEYTSIPFASAPSTGAPDVSALDEALGLIASSRAPVVLAGRGAVRATDELAKLAETLGAPLMTTVRGMGAFEGLQGNLGVFGPSGTPRGQAAIAAADCIIAFGASLNFWTTDRDALTEGRRVVQIDVDPAQLGRWSRIDVGVVGDAGAVADVMRANLEELGVQPRSFAATAREMTVLEASVRHRSPDEPLDVVSALSAIDAAVPGDRTLVVDGGLFILQTFKRMHVESPGAYVHGSCYGSIGLGVGLAVGAAVARPESPTLLVVGDGGFMLGGVNDLWSAVREKLDIIVTLIDDGAFGAEHIQFMRRGMDPSLSYNPWPDLAEVCRSMGAAAVSLKTIADLDKLPTVIGSRSGPLVLHCVIDPDDRGHEAG